MVRLGIFQKIFNINTQKHQPGYSMELWSETRKVRLYSGRKNGVASLLHVMIFIFSLRFRPIWKQIPDLSSYKIMLFLINLSLPQEIFEDDRSTILNNLNIHRILI